MFRLPLNMTQLMAFKYPAGKRRFEPLGVVSDFAWGLKANITSYPMAQLVFSVAMIASFIQVFIESFQRATHSQGDTVVELSKVGIGYVLPCPTPVFCSLAVEPWWQQSLSSLSCNFA